MSNIAVCAEHPKNAASVSTVPEGGLRNIHAINFFGCEQIYLAHV